MRRVCNYRYRSNHSVGLSVEEFWNSVKEGKTNFTRSNTF